MELYEYTDIKPKTGKDIFYTMNMYFKSTDLSWKFCVGICTHSAPSIVDCIKGFVSYIKIQNENVLLIHCFM